MMKQKASSTALRLGSATGCHIATSGLEVKCRFTQTWAQMLVLPLDTRVTLDKSLHLFGLLFHRANDAPWRRLGERNQTAQHLAWAWPRETKVEGPLFFPTLSCPSCPGAGGGS